MPKCKRLFHGSAALATLLALGACSNITRSTSDDLAVTPQANSTYRVSTSADDAEEDNASGTTVTNSKILDLGSQTVGIRFQQIAIPQGAQVRNAYLEFTGSANATGFADFLIYGHASDNSPPFVAGSGSRNISARAKTINSKVWTPAARLAGDVYQPDVTAIVQGLVIRSGWRSGNAMSFMISGSGLRQVDAFDAGTGNGPRLIVDYVSSSALPSCLDDNSDRLFTPTGEYNTTYNSVRDTAGARIDASGAEFSPDVLKGSGPMTAFVARNNNRLCLSGGFYTTEDSPGVHDEAAWKPYLHDGGTILMEDTPNSIVENVAVRLTSDGVQYKAEGGNSGNWTLRHSYFYHVGDDIVENDYMWTGVIDGVLVDWAHTGISCRPGLGSFDNPQADIDQVGS